MRHTPPQVGSITDELMAPSIGDPLAGGQRNPIFDAIILLTTCANTLSLPLRKTPVCVALFG